MSVSTMEKKTFLKHAKWGVFHDVSGYLGYQSHQPNCLTLVPLWEPSSSARRAGRNGSNRSFRASSGRRSRRRVAAAAESSTSTSSRFHYDHDGPGSRWLAHQGHRWVLEDRSKGWSGVPIDPVFTQICRSLPLWQELDGGLGATLETPQSWLCVQGR